MNINRFKKGTESGLLMNGRVQTEKSELRKDFYKTEMVFSQIKKEKIESSIGRRRFVKELVREEGKKVGN